MIKINSGVGTPAFRKKYPSWIYNLNSSEDQKLLGFLNDLSKRNSKQTKEIINKLRKDKRHTTKLGEIVLFPIRGNNLHLGIVEKTIGKIYAKVRLIAASTNSFNDNYFPMNFGEIYKIDYLMLFAPLVNNDLFFSWLPRLIPLAILGYTKRPPFSLLQETIVLENNFLNKSFFKEDHSLPSSDDIAKVISTSHFEVLKEIGLICLKTNVPRRSTYGSYTSIFTTATAA